MWGSLGIVSRSPVGQALHECPQCIEFRLEGGAPCPCGPCGCLRTSSYEALVGLDVASFFENLEVSTQVAVGQMQGLFQVGEGGAIRFDENGENPEPSLLVNEIIEGADRVRLISHADSSCSLSQTPVPRNRVPVPMAAQLAMWRGFRASSTTIVPTTAPPAKATGHDRSMRPNAM